MSRTRRILRAITPILLLAIGIGLLVYGVRGHRVPVVQNREVEETITIPQPPMDPWMPPPPPIKQTITTIERETSDVLEPALIRDVTVGGVALLDTGEIIRTYMAGEDAPALCPT